MEFYGDYLESAREMISKEYAKYVHILFTNPLFRSNASVSLSQSTKMTLPTVFRRTVYKWSLFKDHLALNQLERSKSRPSSIPEERLQEIKEDMRRITERGEIANKDVNFDILFDTGRSPPTIEELNAFIMEAVEQRKTKPSISDNVDKLIAKSREFAEVLHGDPDLIVVPEEHHEDDVHQEIVVDEGGGEEGSIFSTLNHLRKLTSERRTPVGSSELQAEMRDYYDGNMRIVHGRLENLPRPFGTYNPLYESYTEVEEEEDWEEDDMLDYRVVPELRGYFDIPIEMVKVHTQIRPRMFPLKLSPELEVMMNEDGDIDLYFPVENIEEAHEVLKQLALIDVLFSPLVRTSFISNITQAADFYYQTIMKVLYAIQKAGIAKYLRRTSIPRILESVIYLPDDEVHDYHFILDIFQSVCSIAASAVLMDIPIEKVIPIEEIAVIFEIDLFPFVSEIQTNHFLSFLLRIQSNLVEQMPEERTAAMDLWELIKYRRVSAKLVDIKNAYTYGRNIQRLTLPHPLSFFRMELDNSIPRITPKVVEEWWEQYGQKSEFSSAEVQSDVSYHYWEKFALPEFFFIENDVMSKIKGEVVAVYPDEIILRFLPQFQNLFDEKVSIIHPSEIVMYTRDKDVETFLPLDQTNLFPNFGSGGRNKMVHIRPVFVPRTSRLLPPVSLRMKNSEGLVTKLLHILQSTEIKFLSKGSSYLFTFIGIKSRELRVSIKIWERESAIHYKDIGGLMIYMSQIFSILDKEGIEIY